MKIEIDAQIMAQKKLELDIEFPVYRDHLYDETNTISRIEMMSSGKFREITVSQAYYDGTLSVEIDNNFTIDTRCWEWCLGLGPHSGSEIEFNKMLKKITGFLNDT